MGDKWYELTNLDHFWVKHRFKVFNKMFKKNRFNYPIPRVADIGCGQGLLQRQLEDEYRWIVDGYDLNQVALTSSIAVHHPITFYDINERHTDLRGAYDIIFLLDVIEHLQDEIPFLESVKFHLRPGGLLVVNVPAEPWLCSSYDRAVGHFRRYTDKTINKIFCKSGLTLTSSSYWGLAYIPLIMLRKLILRFRPGLTESEIIEAGFKSPAKVFNKLFNLLSIFDKSKKTLSSSP